MKKLLLSLATVLVGLSAAATPFSVANRTKLHPETRSDLKLHEVTSLTTSEKIASRADDSSDEIYFSPAGEPQRALALNSQAAGMQGAMAFQLDPAFIETLTDGQITGISYWTGTEGDEGYNRITKATVFITNDLTAKEMPYTQEITAPNTAFTKVDVTLDTPFNITPGQKVYIGVYFTINSVNNIPFVVDYMGHTNNYGGWLGVRNNSLAKWTWDNVATQVGFFTLGATIKSSTFPRNSVAIVDIDGQPVAGVNDPFGFTFLLQNNGVNSFSTLTVEYGIEGEELVTEDFTLEGGCPINQNIIASIDGIVATKPSKSTNVVVNVKAIDGEANTSEQATASYPVTIVPEESALPRNVVIEEFTSIQCQFCPLGYTSMETIREEYTDGSIIPVCIHSNQMGSDPMTAATYNSIVNKYANGFPSATVNRQYNLYPYYEDLIETAEAIQTLPGVAAVAATATLDKEKRTLTVNSETSFAFDYEDGNANFILAYGITEDNVGPYSQINGYSGGSYGAVPGGWENQPSTVKLIFNDVARQLDKASGVTGSVPAEIKAGEIYEFTHEISLNSAVSDLDNINLVVYLINRKTSAIENACSIKNVANPDASGIESVIDDSEAPVEYFNLQGLRIAEPNGGIFIRRQGNKVSKVLVK